MFDESRLKSSKIMGEIVEKLIQQCINNDVSWQNVGKDENNKESESDDDVRTIIKNMFGDDSDSDSSSDASLNWF